MRDDAKISPLDSFVLDYEDLGDVEKKTLSITNRGATVVAVIASSLTIIMALVVVMLIAYPAILGVLETRPTLPSKVNIWIGNQLR